MTLARWTSTLLVTMVASTAIAAPVATDPLAPSLQRAQAAMADLGQSLRGALQQKIAQDGVVAAVGFCATEAPRIAAEVTARHGVAVGRTSQHYRSPANAPLDWQRAALDVFAARVAKGDDPATLTSRETAGGMLRVAQGITLEAPCLMCHGPKDTMAAELAQAIAATYPQDRATGFAEGDLRGLIWAEVPVDADARVSIAMNAGQQQALRAEMRRHLDHVHQIIAALAQDDWTAVATAAQGFGPGRGAGQHGAGSGQGPGGGRGMGSGASFRSALPAEWFVLARPMHAAMNAVADEAAGQRRVEVALKRLADATAQCTACHATFRVESHADR